MNSFACSGAAFRAVTVATTLAIALAMVSPVAATQSPPIKVGNEIAVNTHADSHQHYPAVARRPDGKTVVVWTSLYQDGDITGTFMQMYNTDRTPFGGEVQVNTNTASFQQNSKVAVAADNSFAVVWLSRHSGPATVQSQRFSSSGVKIGTEFTVGHGLAADVAYLTNGDVVYVWIGRDTSNRLRTQLRRYDSNFAPLSDSEFVDANPGSWAYQDYPGIAALAGGGFIVVFAHVDEVADPAESFVKGQLFTAEGSQVGSTISISASGGYSAVAAFPDGGFIVAWARGDLEEDVWDLRAQHFSAAGDLIGAEILVAGADGSPSVATFSDNSFAIAHSGWTAGFQYFDASHNTVGPSISPSTRMHASPRLASNWNDGDFVAIFTILNFKSSSSGADVAAQWFTADIQTPVPPTPVPPTPVPPTPEPPAQVATPCTSACLRYVCTEGSLFDITVTGVVSDDVWGNAYFTDDSSVAAAAVFDARVAVGETATVTVKCIGPKLNYVQGSANGVTTKPWASFWPASFMFSLGGETQAPPPPSPPRCYHEPCAHGKCNVQGTSFDVIVEGVVSNNIWGTEAFSDDSSVGAAAVHQGLLAVGSVGSVRVSCTGRRESLAGSAQNGVTSNSFGPWEFTYVVHAGPTAAPAPTTDMCVGACLESNCPENRELFLRVHGSTSGYVWGGNVPYTADSTVSAAAVHAGLVSPGTTALVKASCAGPQSSFSGSTQNAVTTASYGPWPEAFTLSAGTEMPTVTCAPGKPCLKSECTVKGRVIKVSVTGSTNTGDVFWGTTLYTGDSPLSHAAVHAGLVTDGQTAVLYATCQGPHDTFTGTAANGVTSTDWTTRWPGSFTLSATL